MFLWQTIVFQAIANSCFFKGDYSFIFKFFANFVALKLFILL